MPRPRPHAARPSVLGVGADGLAEDMTEFLSLTLGRREGSRRYLLPEDHPKQIAVDSEDYESVEKGHATASPARSITGRPGGPCAAPNRRAGGWGGLGCTSTRQTNRRSHLGVAKQGAQHEEEAEGPKGSHQQEVKGQEHGRQAVKARGSGSLRPSVESLRCSTSAAVSKTRAAAAVLPGQAFAGAAGRGRARAGHCPAWDAAGVRAGSPGRRPGAAAAGSCGART